MITYFLCFYSHDNDCLLMNDNEFQVHMFKCVVYQLQAVMDTNTLLQTFIFVAEKNEPTEEVSGKQQRSKYMKKTPAVPVKAVLSM